MSPGPAKGVGMRMHVMRTRFESGARPGPKESLADMVPEIRRLLRTQLSTAQIAEQLGVARNTLMYFVRRRRLCDLDERRKFISLQKTIGEAIE